jgi:copper chaperone CopZ
MTEPTRQAGGQPMIIRAFDVVGMTCEHCVRAVTDEVSALPGVAAVTVDLVPQGKSRLRIESDRPLDATAVAAAVDEAGYALVSGLDIRR